MPSPTRRQALAVGSTGLLALAAAPAGGLLAGVATADITHPTLRPRNDPLYAKAMVLTRGDTTAVLVTLDAVAVGEIGPVGNDFLPTVRRRLQAEIGLPPTHLLVNASHCHGVVGGDVADKTVAAVKAAFAKRVPVTVGVGVGREAGVSENRRLRLKDGREADVRHAYALPADDEVAAVGPIDPRIGVLRLDAADGRPLAVVYHFACHPIMGVNGDGHTADLVGYASQVVEEWLGTVALFVQGCGGDINPVRYKDIHQPRHAEPLGTRLGLSVLRAARSIRCDSSSPLAVVNEPLDLPRADHTARIDALTVEQGRLLKRLTGTSLNLRSFLELAFQHNLSAEFPGYASHLYLTERAQGRDALAKLDAANRRDLKAYIDNVRVMEDLTRVQTNLALLRKHQETNRSAGRKPLRAELAGLRVGGFVLIAFPGELTVDIGLAVQKASPHPHTFISGYTNGYLYYTPTAGQLRNPGHAQEDCDTLVAPEWEPLFHARAATLLKTLLSAR